MGLNTRLTAVAFEAIFIPVKIDEKKIRALFDRISDSHGIKSFGRMPDGAIVMQGGEESNQSKYIIMKDRAVVSFEQCGNSLNYYMSLIDDFFDLFIKETGINLCVAATSTIRRTGTIPGEADSREYILRKAFGMSDKRLGPFKRPLHIFGTRIFFPALPDDPAAYDVKIENSFEDVRMLFLENKGVFAAPFDIKADRARLTKIIELTDKFIEEKVSDFILQFKVEENHEI
ncbi:MAG: hypothetical protein CVV21_11065 [Candidatus Goldiibacteriota bacterium HGW-Goldbacteria-1]|jgi:hypothetical protein|nr:MAG: hypothetical protein CVV21_11065 [Candidatus Goldiibacteriota bacterium HGW-Goldbacteria-1]